MFEKEKKSFVIFCTARSGSYLLVEYLNCFPNIKCFGELFKKNSIELGFDKKKTNFTVETRDQRPLRFLNQAMNFYPKKMTGFKIFPTHNKWVIKSLLENTAFKKVVLHRNPIEVYLSLLNARASGIWVQKGNLKEDVNKPKIKFEATDFEKFNSKLDNYYNRIKEVVKEDGQEVIFITYKEVTERKKIFDVAALLGEQELDIDLTSAMTKQIKDYRSILDNYDEMTNFLSQNHPLLLENSSLTT